MVFAAENTAGVAPLCGVGCCIFQQQEADDIGHTRTASREWTPPGEDIRREALRSSTGTALAAAGGGGISSSGSSGDSPEQKPMPPCDDAGCHRAGSRAGHHGSEADDGV